MRPAGPSAPAAVWPRHGTAERGELRVPATGRGLCLGTAPWAVRDPRMAGTDGGCLRGGRREQRRGHPRGHCRGPVPVLCSSWGSGLAAGLAQAVSASLPGLQGSVGVPRAPGKAARGRLAVPGLPPAADPSLHSHIAAAAAQCGAVGDTQGWGPRSWVLGCCSSRSHGPWGLGARLLSPGVLLQWGPGHPGSWVLFLWTW